MRFHGKLAAALILAAAGLGLTGCQFQIGGPSGCTISNVRLIFEHGRTTLVKYDMSCDSHPISIKHGSAMVLLYFNRGNRKWEGAGKKFITLNTIPPADGKTYPFRFEGTCFPNTREKIHLYVSSSWPSGPDNVDRYVPRVGSFATRGCGQARGQAGTR